MPTIEFFEGPYDGHQQSYANPSQLPTHVIWFVCESGLRRLVGDDEHLKHDAFTSVVRYELEWKTGTARYRFAGAISPIDFDYSRFNIG